MGQRIPNREAELLARLQELSAGEEADRANLEQAILEQQGLNAADRAAVPIITSGTQNFVDSTTGSNFSRSAEALVNQRNLVASGQDGLTKTLNDEFAQRQKVAEQQDLEQELKFLDQERKEADLQRKLVDQQGKEKERDARIRKLNSEAANAGKVGGGSLAEQSRITRNKQIAEEKAGKTFENKFTKPLEKPRAKLREFRSQFRNLKNALESGNRQAIIRTLEPFARSVTGAKGVLTDADIARVLDPTIADRIKGVVDRIRGSTKSTLNFEQRQDLASQLNSTLKEVGTIHRQLINTTSQNFRAEARTFESTLGNIIKAGEDGSASLLDSTTANFLKEADELDSLIVNTDAILDSSTPGSLDGNGAVGNKKARTSGDDAADEFLKSNGL